MKIASIFSQGCGSNHGGYDGGYSDSERHHSHEGSYRSYEGRHNGDGSERHDEGGSRGVLGGPWLWGEGCGGRGGHDRDGDRGSDLGVSRLLDRVVPAPDEDEVCPRVDEFLRALGDEPTLLDLTPHRIIDPVGGE